MKNVFMLGVTTLFTLCQILACAPNPTGTPNPEPTNEGSSGGSSGGFFFPSVETSPSAFGNNPAPQATSNVTSSTPLPAPAQIFSSPIPSGNSGLEQGTSLPSSPVSTTTEENYTFTAPAGQSIETGGKAVYLGDLETMVKDIKATNPSISDEELSAEIQRRLRSGNFKTYAFQTKAGNLLEPLSPPELLLLALHPDLIIPTTTATIDAENYARTHFPDSLYNGKGDAVRHGVWNAYLTYYAFWLGKEKSLARGLGWAKEFSNAHEIGHPSPDREYAMDIHNNRVGRLYARDNFSPFQAKETYADLIRNTTMREITTAEEANNAEEKTLVYIKGY